VGVGVNSHFGPAQKTLESSHNNLTLLLHRDKKSQGFASAWGTLLDYLITRCS